MLNSSRRSTIAPSGLLASRSPVVASRLIRWPVSLAAASGRVTPSASRGMAPMLKLSNGPQLASGEAFVGREKIMLAVKSPTMEPLAGASQDDAGVALPYAALVSIARRADRPVVPCTAPSPMHG